MMGRARSKAATKVLRWCREDSNWRVTIGRLVVLSAEVLMTALLWHADPETRHTVHVVQHVYGSMRRALEAG
jgi:hypothetical protein